MNPQIELEIKNRLEADFKKIAEIASNNSFIARPYISGTIINVTEDIARKYGSELKMGYDSFLRVVEPIADKLKKQYFAWY